MIGINKNSMKDIEIIIGKVLEANTSIEVEQLVAKHSGDDDGVWYFKLDEIEVQVESPTGMEPFLVEGLAKDQVNNVSDVETTVELILKWLK